MATPETEFNYYQSREQQVDHEQIFKALDGYPAPCSNFPDAFYPEHNEFVNEIKAMCASCPAVTQCAIYGVKWEDFGMWGGLMSHERKSLRREAGLS